LREFEEIEISSKAVEATVNSKEEISLRLLSGFRPRIRPVASLIYFKGFIAGCLQNTGGFSVHWLTRHSIKKLILPGRCQSQANIT
jgi:hypothetical protein